MSPFVTFKDALPDGTLGLFICQRNFPHYCGILSYLPIVDSLGCVPISGHNIWISLHGTIRGKILPAYNDIDQQIELILSEMSQWFYLNRIVTDPKRYKKWQIPIS